MYQTRINKFYDMEGIEKPTRNALRAMRVGTTRVFRLPENKFVNTARVMANQLKHEEGLVFQVNADYEAKSVCIRRVK